MRGDARGLRCADRAAVRLRFEERGSGAPPLVFVHGWGCDHRFFAPQLDHFAALHRVLAPDQRGFGQSDKPDAGYSIEGLADDLAWLCAERGLEAPVVVGHSLGGAVALALAARHPQLPAGLALCDPAVFLPVWALELRDAILAGLDSPHYREATARLVERHLFLAADDAAQRGWIVEAMCETPQHVLRSTLEALYDFDAAAAARACPVPVLCIEAGEPLADVAELRAACPGLELASTPGVGHFHTLLAPDSINRILERFVAGLAGPRPR